MIGIWDAYFSLKALATIDGYSIYRDCVGRLYAVTLVVRVGQKHSCLWDDMVYLGPVTQWVENVNGTIIRRGVLTAPLTTVMSSETLTDSYKVNMVPQSTKAINDYVCPACHNNKCSKTEKSCWKCGFSFSNG